MKGQKAIIIEENPGYYQRENEMFVFGLEYWEPQRFLSTISKQSLKHINILLFCIIF